MKREQEIFPYIAHLLNGAEVEWKPLGEVCDKIFAGGTPASTKEEYYNGTIPWLRSGEINFNGIDKTEKTITELGFSKSSARWVRKNSVLLAMTGATVARSAVNNIELTANQSVCALETNESIINYKYLYYCLANKYEALKNQGQGVLSSLNLTTIKKIEIPIPPLSVQQEIVRVLDKFTQLEAELEAELDCRKRQYKYYRDMLLTSDENQVEWKTLGEVGKVRMCKRILKHQTSHIGEIPFYKIGTFGKQPDAFISKEIFTEYKEKYNYPKKGEILISASGTIGRTVVFDGEDAYFQDSNIVWIENDEREVLNKFLFYYYKVVNWNISEGGTIKRLYNDNLSKIKIPIPPIEEQERISGILDKFDTLVNSISEGLPREIELRRKQYEYYREKLLSFPKN